MVFKPPPFVWKCFLFFFVANIYYFLLLPIIENLWSYQNARQNFKPILNEFKDIQELRWLPLEDNGTLYSFVAAAFYDSRVDRIVVLLSGRHGGSAFAPEGKKLTFRYKCLLYNDSAEKLPVEVDGILKTDFMLYCRVDNHNIPFSISIQYIEHGHVTSANWTTPVFNMDERKGNIANQKKLALCVGLLMNGYQNWLMLLQYIEYHRMRGVTKMIFFYTDIHWTTKKIFDWYQQNYFDFLETVEWYSYHFPWDDDYSNQFMRNNLCVYSLMYKYQYVASNDMDELYFTVDDNRLDDVLDDMNLPDRGSFLFRAKYHLIPSLDIPELSEKRMSNVSEVVSNYIPLYHFKNVSTFAPYDFSPKEIVKPETVIVFSVHSVVEYVRGSKVYYIPESVGFLRHFKIRTWWGDWTEVAEKHIKFEMSNPWSNIGQTILLNLINNVTFVVKQIF